MRVAKSFFRGMVFIFFVDSFFIVVRVSFDEYKCDYISFMFKIFRSFFVDFKL